MTLDKRYRDELSTALRWRNLSKQQINEVLAEVEAHVTETGEDPVDAFGQPRQYADAVAEQAHSMPAKRGALTGLGSTIVVCVLGFLGVRYGLDGLDSDGMISVTAADFSVVILTPVAASIAGFFFVRGFSTSLDRAMYFRSGVLVLLVGGIVAMMFYGPTLTIEMFTIANTPSLVLGILLLAMAAAVGVLAKRRHDRLAPS